MKGNQAMSILAKALALGIVFTAALASPASAVAGLKTRLVSCDAGSCLLVTGRRAAAASTVTINGHAVSTQGARKWRASLPVDTVREWSAPYARTITVAVVDGTHETASAEADLPIGLLGRAETLAMLVVSAK
jgi:hypothetical protein